MKNDQLHTIKCTDKTEKHATHTRLMCTTYMCIWVIVEASLRIVIVARRLIILIGGCIRKSCELANNSINNGGKNLSWQIRKDRDRNKDAFQIFILYFYQA